MDASIKHWLYGSDSDSRMNASEQRWLPPQCVNHIIVIICGVIIVIGVIGNVIILLVVGFVPGLKTSVNLCLASLAFIDTLILCLLPILPAISTLNTDFIAIGREMCHFLLIIDRGAVSCSVLTFLLITIERYVAICHPLLSARLLSKKVIFMCLTIIWTVAVLLSLPYAFLINYEGGPGTGNLTTCSYHFDRPWAYIYDTIVVTGLAFGPVPMLLILYLRMRSALRSNHLDINRSSNTGRHQVTKMLFAVLVIFVLCQLPYAVLVMLEYYHLDVFPFSRRTTPAMYGALWLSQILFYINSAINPIVYLSMSSKYRQGFCFLFVRCGRMRPDIERRSIPVSANGRF